MSAIIDYLNELRKQLANGDATENPYRPTLQSLSALVTANLQRATRLRQSILQKAFTGELV
jgi:hypothetical protein